MDLKERESKIRKVTLWGSFVNFILLAFKFVSGILGNSNAMLADAIHSLSDFVTDVIVLFFVNIASKPKDDKHDFGHGKFETLASSIIGLVLLFIGCGLFWNGATSIFNYFYCGQELKAPEGIAFYAAVISIVCKEIMYRYTRYVAKQVESTVVMANAWHHRSDAFSSIGTALGIGGAVYLGKGWVLLDPLAAIVVSAFIVKGSLEVIRPSLDDLLDRSLSPEIESDILSIILSEKGVSNPHNLQTRKMGSVFSINVHIRVDGDMSVAQAHMITKQIEKKIKEKYGYSTLISLHVEPLKKESIFENGN